MRLRSAFDRAGLFNEKVKQTALGREGVWFDLKGLDNPGENIRDLIGERMEHAHRAAAKQSD